MSIRRFPSAKNPFPLERRPKDAPSGEWPDGLFLFTGKSKPHAIKVLKGYGKDNAVSMTLPKKI